MAQKLIFSKTYPYIPSKKHGVTQVYYAGPQAQTVNDECAERAIAAGYATPVKSKSKSKDDAGGSPES